MVARSRQRLALGLCLLAWGCKRANTEDALAPASPQDLPQLLQELERNRAELTAMGVSAPPPTKVAFAQPAADERAPAEAGPATPSPADPAPAEAVMESEPAPEADSDDAELDAPARVVQTESRRRARRSRVDRQRSSSRCERLEALADVACTLERRICDLATEHEGEPRYEEACERAMAQCSAATEAVDECEV